MLCFAEPSVLEVLQDGLDPGARTGEVACISDRDGESTTQETAQVSVWMGETVFFVVTVGEGDEDAEVMLPGSDAD